MSANEVSRKIMVALAAEELCKEKRFRSITVPELCEKAGLSKTSFYRLFADKFDVALWIQSIPLLEGVGECGRTLDLVQGITVTLQGQALFRNLYLQSASAGEVLSPDERARVSSSDVVRETITDYHHLELDDALDFQVEWFSVASREVVKTWLREDRGYDASAIAEMIAQCCPRRLGEILDDPVDPKAAEPVDFQRLMVMAMEH